MMIIKFRLFFVYEIRYDLDVVIFCKQFDLHCLKQNAGCSLLQMYYGILEENCVNVVSFSLKSTFHLKFKDRASCLTTALTVIIFINFTVFLPGLRDF